MARKRVTMTVKVDGLTPAVRAFNQYGKEANGELRDAAQRTVNQIAPALVSVMAADGGPSALVASSIKARRDRVPVLAAGGTKRVASKAKKGRARASAGDLFFGAEFGGGARSTTRQFRPWRGTAGYAFYPELRARIPSLIDAYKAELARLAGKWSHGG